MHPSFKTLAVASTFLASMAAGWTAHATEFNPTSTSCEAGHTNCAFYSFSSGSISYGLSANNGSYDGASGQLYNNGETWIINDFIDGNADANEGKNNWGSPGVGSDYSTYGGTGATPAVEGEKAIGFVIFFGPNLSSSPVSVNTADGSMGTNCEGGQGGGTVFCNEFTNTPDSQLITSVQWAGTTVTNSTNSNQGIVFWAPNSGSYQTPNESYFVNVFLNGSTPTALPSSFSGAWIYAAAAPNTTPEPATLAIMGVGLAGLGAIRRRRRRS